MAASFDWKLLRTSRYDRSDVPSVRPPTRPPNSTLGLAGNGSSGPKHGPLMSPVQLAPRWCGASGYLAPWPGTNDCPSGLLPSRYAACRAAKHRNPEVSAPGTTSAAASAMSCALALYRLAPHSSHQANPAGVRHGRSSVAEHSPAPRHLATKLVSKLDALFDSAASARLLHNSPTVASGRVFSQSALVADCFTANAASQYTPTRLQTTSRPASAAHSMDAASARSSSSLWLG
mmetsp:Transcript_8261/g.24966  ORF Transcript_8261/g.24966 Transcript_8261/m.24966 type:complete len:233 (+) Transcript_8261:180-878(+)